MIQYSISPSGCTRAFEPTPAEGAQQPCPKSNHLSIEARHLSWTRSQLDPLLHTVPGLGGLSSGDPENVRSTAMED